MVLLFCLQVLRPVAAQEPIALPRLSEAVQLDGLSDEPAWQAVAPFPMTMYQPTFEGTMTERTEVRVAHDDEYLYIAGRLYDSDPAGVLASSLYRDRGTSADDYLNVVLDPFNDNENALWFWTTPAGIRGDMAVSNDSEGDNAMNGNWDTFWDVATVQNEEGWFAEMRIPFSSLGFQQTNGQVVMGLAISRTISRKNERHIFPAIPPNWNLGFAKPSLAQDILLEDVTSQKPIYITPYLLGGAERSARLNNAETAFQHQDDVSQDLGLDLKYNVTSNLTLDVSVNTDFAQVEADDQRVNLTRFSLFFPERRPFFQERAGVFEYAFGFQERLFHSRQIGLSQGQPVPILGGARLVGRTGQWDVGALAMQTGRGAGLPAENFGVIRLRRNVFNDNSYAGGIATSRVDEEGRYNLVYGLDGLFRVVGDEYLTLKWAQSFEEEIVQERPLDVWQAGFLQARWERRRQQGLNYGAWLTRWGRDFFPATGFFTRVNYTQTLGRLAYDRLPGAQSPFRRITHGVFSNLFFRNDDGTVETGFWGTFNDLEFKSGAEVGFEVVGNYEDLQSVLPFTDVVDVPVGGYTFYTAELSYMMPSGRRFRSGASAEAGSFYDGRLFKASLSPTWNASRHLEVGGSYALNVVRFPDRDQGFEAHVVQVRTRAAINRKVSASAFIQYSSLADLVSANVRFRYNFRERNDLWIVYDEGLNTDRHRLVPSFPVSNSRTLLLKYTYTFTL